MASAVEPAVIAAVQEELDAQRAAATPAAIEVRYQGNC